MKKDIAELVFIVDRSGSMTGLESDTIGGFNATLDAHRKTDSETLVSTVLFDHELIRLHDRLPIAEVPPMTESDYVPRGMTALLDAVGRTIAHISSVHGYLPEDHKPEHTIVVITTDGFENASHEYTYNKVKALIEQKKEQGWEFLFLGANIDAAEEAGNLGIDADHAATFLADDEGVARMYEAQAQATVNMACGASFNPNWKNSIESDTKRRLKKSHRLFGRKHA